jgi:hypothetical protein
MVRHETNSKLFTMTRSTVLKGKIAGDELTFVDTTATYSKSVSAGTWTAVALKRTGGLYKTLAPMSLFPAY